ncbi:MAG: hypothetical protein ACRESZ_10540 [Methylococcales bacterium]
MNKHRLTMIDSVSPIAQQIPAPWYFRHEDTANSSIDTRGRIAAIKIYTQPGIAAG